MCSSDLTQELCGVEVTSAQVSRASQLLDEELEIWRTRPLGEIPYLVLDARYEKVRHGGHIVDVALLIAVGVQAEGKRTVLGVSVSLSEAEIHWRSFLATLLERGVHGVKLIVSDDHAGLKQARQAALPSVPWQRLQLHPHNKAQAHVPPHAPPAEVARAHSEDPGSAAHGGDLGCFSAGTMVPEFEEAAFALKPGETSEPVLSPYGYHLIKLREKREDALCANHILVLARTGEGDKDATRDELVDLQRRARAGEEDRKSVV